MKIQARRKSNGDSILGSWHFRVSHFWISSINIPQREMVLNIFVAYKWLHLYINSLLKKREGFGNKILQGTGLV